MTTALHTVHVRVNDAATGKPTPCRIRFSDADGRYYAPFGRAEKHSTDTFLFDSGGNVIIGEQLHAYIDGTCEIALPAGALRVRIDKGPEYQPIETEVSLTPGKLALRFVLQRWINLREQRWYSGDTRVYFSTPHTALLEGAAEDVAVVNLLARELSSGKRGEGQERCPCYSNITAFSGQRPALEAPGHMVVVNTMNLHVALGRLLLLNCHRIVYPLFFGGPDGLENWTLTDWCDQCHRKGGLVVGDNFFWRSPGRTHGELLADIVLGKIDALELDDFEQPEANDEIGPALDEWHGLLDCGYRIPLVGGSGKMTPFERPGRVRTYARLEEGQEFTYRNWIEAVRAGRTFVTTGPLVLLTVNGADPGTVLNVSPDKAVVRVRAEARSLNSFERLEVVANHSVIATATPSGFPPSALIEADVPLARSGWVVARCVEPWREFQEVRTGAQTSPVYVEVAGRPRQVDSAVMVSFMSDLDQTLQWVLTKARCDTDKQRDDLRHVFEDARQRLLTLASPQR